MQEDPAAAENYLLGHSPRAIQRLRLLGQLCQPFTRRVLAEAGITPGMQVLDVGCGPGDVSLIAAELVGATGRVLGIDASAEMLQVAEARVRAAGLRHVSFRAADLRTLVLDQPVDALVGRFILMHLPDPAAVLKQLCQAVRPGGVVVFQEYDLSSHGDAFSPPSPLWEQIWRLTTLPFQRAGGNLHAGMQLPSLFRAAGLPPPRLSYDAAIGATADWPGFELWAADVRTFLPLSLQFGLVTEDEIGIDTLAERLRAETVGQGGAARMPVVVSAWVRTPATA